MIRSFAFFASLSATRVNADERPTTHEQRCVLCEILTGWENACDGL